MRNATCGRNDLPPGGFWESFGCARAPRQQEDETNGGQCRTRTCELLLVRQGKNPTSLLNDLGTFFSFGRI